MLLQNLYKDYAFITKQLHDDDYEELPSGFSNKKCHWKVVINPSNMEYQFTPLNIDSKGKGGLFLQVPNISRSIDVTPFLVVDNQKYVFGRSAKTQKNNFLELRYQAYKDLLSLCYDKTSHQALKVILDFLQLDIQFPDLLSDEHWITFEVKGYEDFLFDEDILRFWNNHLFPKNENAITQQCCVTGEESEIIKVAKIKIKCPKLTGDGLALLTANNEVFQHYGFEQAANSPISLDVFAKTHNILNDLFQSDRHTIKFGKNVYVFWSKSYNSFLPFMDDDPQTIKDLFESYMNGKIWSDNKLNQFDKFNIFGFTNLSTRLVIKYANELTLKRLYENQYKWLKSIQLYNDGKSEFPELWKLLKTLYNTEDKKQSADYESYILDSIVSGKSLPQFILAQLVRRAIINVLDKKSLGLTHALISLIKACLYDTIEKKGYDMISEQINCDDVAYNLGRLWALFEKLQIDALGKRPNASITDKNFKSACNYPKKTIGRLQNNIDYYLSRLKKNNFGKSIWLEREIMKVTDQISSFPDKISMKDQGMFFLGYYHKKSSLYTKSESVSGENQNVAVN